MQKTICNVYKECVPAEMDTERTARDRSVVNVPFLVVDKNLTPIQHNEISC